ncbi:MAG TPA: hypothetical protein PKY10_07660, partial [Lentisphaeria bacterium]|nr:hypothetical protein [Lentisphaeria bacterium]
LQLAVRSSSFSLQYVVQAVLCSGLCLALSGLQIIFHLTQGGASPDGPLALGWYVTPRWGFCRFAAVDLVDGGFLNFTLLAFCYCTVNPENLCVFLGVLGG